MPETTNTFSWFTLLLLVLLFGLSLGMFMILERRWTTQRKWVELREWARSRGLRMRRSGHVPEALAMITFAQPWVRLLFWDEGMSLLQLQTMQPEARGWNVLVARCVGWRGGPAAIRPVHQPASLMDLLNLPVVPTPVGTARFVALARETRSARMLVSSPVRGLIPPDVGLLRTEQWLVLDFSTRPFDPVELDRMLELARQIIHLG
jgi:hypothetical protein